MLGVPTGRVQKRQLILMRFSPEELDRLDSVAGLGRSVDQNVVADFEPEVGWQYVGWFGFGFRNVAAVEAKILV